MRGLNDETIRKWRLGFHANRVREPGHLWGVGNRPIVLERGIVVPCEIGGTMWYFKVRRPMATKDGQPDALGRCIEGLLHTSGKYVPVRGHKPALFGASTLAGHEAAVLVEGEFDVMVLNQQAGDLVGACTMGSADIRLAGDWSLDLCVVRRILVVFDGDAKGQSAARRAAGLSARARTLGWPEGIKDASDFHERGGDLRRWAEYHLECGAVRPDNAGPGAYAYG